MIFSIEITDMKSKRIIQPESITNVQGLNSYLRHFLCYNKEQRIELLARFKERKKVKAEGRKTPDRHYSIEATLIEKVA